VEDGAVSQLRHDLSGYVDVLSDKDGDEKRFWFDVNAACWPPPADRGEVA